MPSQAVLQQTLLPVGPLQLPLTHSSAVAQAMPFAFLSRHVLPPLQ